MTFHQKVSWEKGTCSNLKSKTKLLVRFKKLLVLWMAGLLLPMSFSCYKIIHMFSRQIILFWTLKDAHDPRTRECVTLHGNGELKMHLELRLLINWPQNKESIWIIWCASIIASVLKRGRRKQSKSSGWQNMRGTQPAGWLCRWRKRTMSRGPWAFSRSWKGQQSESFHFPRVSRKKELSWLFDFWPVRPSLHCKPQTRKKEKIKITQIIS